MKNKVAALNVSMVIGVTMVLPAYAVGLDELELGIGVESESSIYKTVDDETQAMPIINAELGNFYIQGGDIGYNIIDNENVTIGPVVSLFEGYGFDQEYLGVGYKGLETRDGGASYGLLAEFEMEPFAFELKPMSHSKEGNSIELSVEYEIRGRSFLLMPALFIEHLDKDYTDYYFGVSQAEVNNRLNTGLTRSYTASSATNIGIEIGAFYQLSPRWLLSGRVEYTKFDSSITDSPLVDEKSSTSIAAGISYRF